jgi:DNA-binding CsgD family transcriptional regulator
MAPHPNPEPPSGQAPVPHGLLQLHRDLKDFEPDQAARLQGDQDELLEASLAGHQGRTWERLRRRLADYAYKVLTKWIRVGIVGAKCAGIQVRCRPVRSDARTEEAAAEIAAEVVAVALLDFQDRVLRAGRWDPTRGATLTTFFVGCCLQHFPNVYRHWERERIRWRRGDETQCVLSEEALRVRFDLGVEHRAYLEPRLARLSEGEARLVGLWLRGYTHPEIGEALGKSTKAVESQWARITAKLR